MYRYVALALFLSAALFPSSSFAHFEGVSIEREIGEYLFDVGYSPEIVVAGESVYFDFRLYQKGDEPGIADFSDVWVRIERDETTLFATGIAKATLGTTGVVYTFDTPGIYGVSARYENGEAALGEVEFKVEVKAKAKGVRTYVPYLVAGIAGFIVGGACFRFFRRVWVS